MHFFGTCQRVAKIDDELIERAYQLAISLDPTETFTYQDTNVATGRSSWWRADSWLKGEDKWTPGIRKLEPIAREVAAAIQADWSRGPSVRMTYFNLSVITPREYIDEHSDPKLLNKLSYRILVPLNPKLVFKYHHNFNGRKVYSEISRGHAYHFNNNDIHAAYNESDEYRYAFMYDFTEERLYEKFASTPDWHMGLVFGTVNKDFLERHKGHVF